MQLVKRYGEFPILLEAYREAWDDLLRVRDFRKVADGIRSGEIAVRRIASDIPTPFAMHFLFDYNMAFQYVGDYPRAEWRSQLLAVDRDLLARVVRPDALPELLDDRSRPRGPDELADALDALGDLSERELSVRCGPRWREWIEALEADGRAVRIEVAGEDRWVAVEHVEDYRAMVGGDLDAAGRVVRRHLAGRGPVTEEEVAGRLGLDTTEAAAILLDLRATGEVAAGEFRPAGSGREWVDTDNLRRIHRETLQILRQEVEPVDPERYADFLAERNLAAVPATDAAAEAVLERLVGLPVPAASLIPEVLAPRFRDGDTSAAERLAGSGTYLWQGLPGKRVALIPRRGASRLLRPPARGGSVVVEEVLRTRGASFLSEVASAAEIPEREALTALFELVWAGRVTNDALVGIIEPPRTRRRSRGAPRMPLYGRWSLLPEPEDDPTLRAEVWAERLLESYGV